jgi:regulator of PEP synthase PpsR (kinase-PPPase family)
VGRSHSQSSPEYSSRIEAMNFALAHDDGVSDVDLKSADIILVGVSRSGKTPTSLYLSLQFSLKAANYPLIPEDFERDHLPSKLQPFRGKLFGLTIDPEQLQRIRTERRPNSKYASIDNCRYEVAAAEKMMRREGIKWFDTTSRSIEELAVQLMQELDLER